MVRTQIQLSERQSSALKEIAASEGVPVAELVRRGVDELLRRRPALDREALKRRALAVGRFRSGVPDLAAQHDRYLDEALAD